MGRVCCVKSCRRSSKKNPELRFFCIPVIINNQCEKTKYLSEERRKGWIKALSLGSQTPEELSRLRVCSSHFNTGSPSKLFDNTHPDWLPSQALEMPKNIVTSTPLSHAIKYGATVQKRLFSTAEESDLSIENRSLGTSFNESVDKSLRPYLNTDDSGVLSDDETNSILKTNQEADKSVQSLHKIVIEDMTHNRETQTEFFSHNQDTQTEDFKINEETQTSNEFATSVETQTTNEFATSVETQTTTELTSTKEIQTDSVEFTSVETQTLFRISYTFELESMELKIQQLTSELEKLRLNLQDAENQAEKFKEELKTEKIKVANFEINLKKLYHDEESYLGDNEKVKFFTGLENFDYLKAIFQEVEAYLFKRSKLTQFQQYILTLMKLRLALKNKHLAYIFNVSETTIGRIFYNCLNALYKRLSRCIYWPERENLHATMPRCFREKFGNKVAVIIDCFEVFTEKPSSVISQAETWSNYKHNNTVKYLIGITPQGTISFISKGWGGRVSDQMLTIESGILKKLVPGDVVLADRGFDISEEVSFYCATIKIPAFTKKVPQLDPFDVEETRKLANVRIHVERVIGCLRQKYEILHTKIPIELLDCVADEEVSTIDKITIVASALINLCPSVVPMD